MGKVNKTNSYTEFYYEAFRNILLVSVTLVIVSAVVLSLPHSSAYSSSTDNVSLSLPTSCTLSADVTRPHNITMQNGRYEHDIGNTRLSAYCNDNNGYYIYALGVSNNLDGNTDLVSSIGGNYNIHTAVYNSENLTNTTPSSWAMKLTAGTGTNATTTVPVVVPEYTNYHTIPSSSTVVAYRASNTDMTTNTDLTGSFIDTTYEIYTSPTQANGTYLGKVKYVMVHPYNPALVKSFDDTFDIAGKDKVTILDPTTGESKSYYTMQDMTPNICNLVGLYNDDSETELLDIRDNTLYYVAKLEDNNCWMTQNLELDLISDTTSPNYTPLNSNNTDISLDSYNPNGGAYSSAGGYTMNNDNTILTWVPENSTIPAGSLNSTIWNHDTSATASYNPGDKYYYPNYQSDINSGNDFSYTLAACEAQGHTDCKHYKAGNYYNWSAAVASNNTSTITSGSAADNSICPKGWRLPQNNSTNDFSVLSGIYSITASNALDLRNSPLYFVRAGVIVTSGGPLYQTSVQGNYIYSSNLHMNFGQNSYNSNAGNGWVDGFSLRCLAR